VPDEPPTPPKLQIQIDDDVAQGTYTNLVLINHTENEFLLDFAFLQPGTPRAKVRARMISSPRHTKRILLALQKNVERFEERFGPIEVPAEDDGPVVHCGMVRSAVIPAALRDGDVVGVCAPAGRPPTERLRRGLDRLGQRFTVRLGPVAAAALRGDPSSAPPYLAADDRARAGELNALLADPDVRAIFVGRGGYGATRILPDLDPAPLVADPRPIIGFSDITAILAWAERNGVRAVHGPVITQLGELPAGEVEWLYRVLTSTAPLGRVPWALAGGRPGAPVVRGRLVGGNLCLIARLVGTPWQIDTADAIVFLEEVGEAPYVIDRDLTQIGMGGHLEHVRAALIGDLARCTDPPHVAGAVDEPGPAFAALGERLGRWRVPALTGLPIGHGQRNAALPYGAMASVDLAAGVMEIEDAAVA
jgi:muramoyltetrapeptide carboxypeptidase